MFYSLTYVSTACVPLTRLQLERIIRISRTANQRDSITGMLLYKGGVFMQVLEGARRKVEDKKQRIVLDPRHKNVIVILQGSAFAREFPRSAMGFMDLNEIEEHELYMADPRLGSGFTDKVFVDEPQNARKLLLSSHGLMRKIQSRLELNR